MQPSVFVASDPLIVEADRLAAVRRYDVLDTPPDGAFDRITALAARLFQVPISIVSIVDTDRIWFKSHHGLAVDQVDRAPGLCASAVIQSGPWLVADASVDPRTLANPLVAGEFGFRFYAGVPLTTYDGHNLGTLCVIDVVPRETSAEEVATLTDLASVVMDELELRLSSGRSLAAEATLRLGAQQLNRSLQESLLPARLPSVPGLDVAARYHVAHTDEVGGDFYDVVRTDDGCAVVSGDVSGKGTVAASWTAAARWALRALIGRPWTPADTLRQLNEVMVRADDDPERSCTVALVSLRPGEAGNVDLVVSLGGHPHPLVVRRDGRVAALGSPGPAIGWLPDAAFTDTTDTLASGDVLVVFTDGLLEAVAGHGDVDDDAIRRVLAPLAGHAAATVADRLDDVLGDSTLRDDAAYLVIRAR